MKNLSGHRNSIEPPSKENFTLPRKRKVPFGIKFVVYVFVYWVVVVQVLKGVVFIIYLLDDPFRGEEYVAYLIGQIIDFVVLYFYFKSGRWILQGLRKGVKGFLWINGLSIILGIFLGEISAVFGTMIRLVIGYLILIRHEDFFTAGGEEILTVPPLQKTSSGEDKNNSPL